VIIILNVLHLYNMY